MENRLIDWLHKHHTDPTGTILGLGDDTLVVDPGSGGPVVMSTDQVVEGVHFESGYSEGGTIGKKAVHHALSDLAASAAEPWFCLGTLALPPQFSEKSALQVLEGMSAAANSWGAPLAGGDLSGSRTDLVITVTAVGRMGGRTPWRRDGARPGDQIFVTGALGGSSLGRHFHFVPRIEEALWLDQNLTVRAAMDISDGLGLDLYRLLKASNCGARIDRGAVPISEDARVLSRSSGRSAFEHAWGDGEDFELLVVVDSGSGQGLESLPGGVAWTKIGEVNDDAGLIRDETGATLEASGWEHRK